MIRFFLIFIFLSVLMTLGLSFFDWDLGTGNYWNHHGVLLLVFLSFFPRLALLFSSIPFGGLFWWLGFIFAPHYLVAVLATLNYWHQNPILVSISWLVALGGESTEKYFIKRRVHVRKYKYTGNGPVIDVDAHEVR